MPSGSLSLFILKKKTIISFTYLKGELYILIFLPPKTEPTKNENEPPDEVTQNSRTRKENYVPQNQREKKELCSKER